MNSTLLVGGEVAYEREKPGLGNLDPDVQLGDRNDAKIVMIQRGDCVGLGLWHWRCKRESADGDIAFGFVCADPLGLKIVPGSFEKDRR